MRQLSLLEQARLMAGGTTDVDLVTEIAADTVEELGLEPPIDLRVVASYRDIRFIRVEAMPVAGSLTPEPSGLVMRLARGDSRRRRRFTGFHEVGHTFLPGYYETTSRRCPNPSGRPRTGSDPETLSDVAAAELLLPAAHFVPALAGEDFGWEGVSRLSDCFDASVQATAYRYVRFWPEHVLFVVLEPGLRKAELGQPGIEPKLRVRSRFLTGQWPYVPINKSARPDGPLNRALAGEVVHEPATLAELELDDDRPVELSARAFHYTAADGTIRERVMALYRRKPSVSVARSRSRG